MILTVLFTLAGALAVIVGFAVWAAGDFTFAGLLIAGPAFLSALALFGLAQVIHALIRTANATERAVSLLDEIKRRVGPR